MKTSFTSIITLCLLFSTGVNAKIWQVNNTAIADFTTIQGAHDNANVKAGDTLYLTGSGISYGGLVSTKKLIILGPGYFIAENTGLQANILTAKVPSIDLRQGSEGTIISGLQIDGNGSINGKCIIRTGNITISRNLFTDNSSYACIMFDVTVSYSYSNIIISQNYFKSTYYPNDYNPSTAISINNKQAGNNAMITNVLINNNIFTDYSPQLYNQTSGIFSNNIIQSPVSFNAAGKLELSNFTIQNNIFTCNPSIFGITNESLLNGTGNYITNNICFAGFLNTGGLLAGINTTIITNLSQLFVTSGTTDGKWQLNSSSLAKGAGVGGVDCGVFGGSSPYVLSGLPAIPSVFKFTVPANSNGNSLPITFSVKSNN